MKVLVWADGHSTLVVVAADVEDARRVVKREVQDLQAAHDWWEEHQEKPWKVERDAAKAAWDLTSDGQEVCDAHERGPYRHLLLNTWPHFWLSKAGRRILKKQPEASEPPLWSRLGAETLVDDAPVAEHSTTLGGIVHYGVWVE